MIGWLRNFFHHLFGPDRYHEQANAVTNRRIRVELLEKELDLYRRGKQ